MAEVVVLAFASATLFVVGWVPLAGKFVFVFFNSTSHHLHFDTECLSLLYRSGFH
jgi:hypothetical protein